ncbi:MAG: hypothetical protein LCI00_11155 [Chloroflexi bacterium]|nr:hypothetical protein [Chloroflexota bacterium]
MVVGSYQFPVVSFQLSVSSWQLAVISFQLSVSSWQLIVQSKRRNVQNSAKTANATTAWVADVREQTAENS